MNSNVISAYTPVAASQTLVSPSSAAANRADPGQFQELFTALLLASTLSNSGAKGLPGGDLITPILLGLLEKLLAQEISGEEIAAPPLQTSADETKTRWGEAQPQGAPVKGVLTQAYHARHYGLDFGIAVGTPIRTTMDGKVVYAGWNNEGYGNLVIVENGAYRTYYAHLSQIPVTVGQSVQAGSVIGLSGNTGNSTGPHLHYEVRIDGKPIDPTSITLNQG